MFGNNFSWGVWVVEKDADEGMISSDCNMDEAEQEDNEQDEKCYVPGDSLLLREEANAGGHAIILEKDNKRIKH